MSLMTAERDRSTVLVAELISSTGSTMAAIALPWWVLTATGSASKAALVLTLELVPMALLAIPSGAVASRLGLVQTMIVADALRAVAAAAMAALIWLDALPFGLILLLALILGSLAPAHFAAQRALVPELVGEDTGSVGRMNAVLQAANRLPIVTGPLCAGVLISTLQAPAVLLIDAATFGSSALLLRTVSFRSNASSDENAAGLLRGLTTVISARLLRRLLVANAGGEFATQTVFLSLPILAYTSVDRDVRLAGMVMAAWGAGTLLGMPVAGWLAGREPGHLARI